MLGPDRERVSDLGLVLGPDPELGSDLGLVLGPDPELGSVWASFLRYYRNHFRSYCFRTELLPDSFLLLESPLMPVLVSAFCFSAGA